MTTTIRKPMHRRTVLRGAGGVAIALPFLNAMRPRRASAATAPRRLVLWFIPMGTNMDTWAPTNAQWNPSMGIGPPCKPAMNLSGGPLGPGRLGCGSHLVGETDFELGIQMKPLERHKKDLLILRGVRIPWAHAHTLGPYTMATGRKYIENQNGFKYSAAGPSIDQHIVKSLDLAQKTKIGSLHLGVNVAKKDGEPPWQFWVDAFQPITPQDNPYEVFKQLFGQFSGPGLDPATIDRLRAARKSVLDSVLQNAGTFTAKLGVEDRRKLDVHLDGIRQIEKNLENTKLAAGGMCKVPELGGQPMVDFAANDNVPVVGKMMMDLMVMALACDLTRVVTIQWGREGVGAAYSHTWVPGGAGGWHGISHDKTNFGAVAGEKLTKVWAWYHEQLAGMLDKMKTFDEGGRTLLDNSSILTTSNIGPGNEDDPRSHYALDIPFLLAGSCGGAFKTGRHLFYGGPITTASGLTNTFGDATRPFANQLWVALMNAMGVAGDRFGPEMGPGLDVNYPPRPIPPGPLPRLSG